MRPGDAEFWRHPAVSLAEARLRRAKAKAMLGEGGPRRKPRA
ncbi:hypothetical protein SUS17_39 [Sphingomonas sp. S17]|nr:hypothetical protein SUS17_39 [Sphingomonas sp. S17]